MANKGRDAQLANKIKDYAQDFQQDGNVANATANLRHLFGIHAHWVGPQKSLAISQTRRIASMMLRRFPFLVPVAGRELADDQRAFVDFALIAAHHTFGGIFRVTSATPAIAVAYGEPGQERGCVYMGRRLKDKGPHLHWVEVDAGQIALPAQECSNPELMLRDLRLG